MGRVSRKCLLGAFGGDVLSKECFLLRRQFVKDKRGLRTWSVDVEETPTFLNTKFLKIKVLVRFGCYILLWVAIHCCARCFSVYCVQILQTKMVEDMYKRQKIYLKFIQLGGSEILLCIAHCTVHWYVWGQWSTCFGFGAWFWWFLWSTYIYNDLKLVFFAHTNQRWPCM